MAQEVNRNWKPKLSKPSLQELKTEPEALEPSSVQETKPELESYHLFKLKTVQEIGQI